jgi:uncharacterized membrane protein
MHRLSDPVGEFFFPGAKVKHRYNWGDLAIGAGCEVVTVVLLSITALGWAGLARVLLTFAFMVYVPGWAVVANCTPLLRASRAALPVVVSFTLVTATVTLTLWLHIWHPLQLFDVEAGASIALIGIAAIRDRRRQREDEPDPRRALPENDA